MIEPKLLKGFRDFPPSRALARQSIIDSVRAVFLRFGFLPLDTPALEYKEILTGKYGSDEKLIYKFTDNGDREVAMRYDLTVPLARFVAANQGQLVYPFKRSQIAPVWRADNPQKGRFREFYQCDIDVVGSASANADGEVIACAAKALEEIGINDFVVRINDRRNFEMFGEDATEIIRSVDKFEKIGLDAVLKELEDKGKKPKVLAEVKSYLMKQTELPQKSSLEALIDIIASYGINKDKIIIDPTIARGLDYYTSTVCEISMSNNPEFGSIASGGRYDSLLANFSKDSLPCVGMSIGLDRLFDYLEDQLAKQNPIAVLVLNLDDTLGETYRSLVTELREAGINAEMYFEAAKLDKQFKYGESKGIPKAVIVGPEELKKGEVQIKDMENRTQVTVPKADILKSLK